MLPTHFPGLFQLLKHSCVQAKLARGQGARVKKLKRKVSWHADELQQEKAKVASIQQELSSTNQELRFLRQQVAHLQHAAQHPIVGLAPSMQPRLFGPYPLLAQENQPAAYFAARVQVICFCTCAQMSSCWHNVQKCGAYMFMVWQSNATLGI